MVVLLAQGAIVIVHEPGATELASSAGLRLRLTGHIQRSNSAYYTRSGAYCVTRAGSAAHRVVPAPLSPYTSPMSARIIAIVSHKGGTGKTSLAQNLGAELARLGKRVLLIDFDPQHNLTTGWGIKAESIPHTIYQALLAPEPETIVECVRHIRPKLSLIPATLDLAGAELAFTARAERALKLRPVAAFLRSYYDLILIDTPPSLGFFTVNALAAADDVLIPLQAQVYAYKALDQLLPIIQQVQEINPALRLSGIVLSMYDPRNALSSSIHDLARQRFGNLVFDTMIPINVRIAEAPLDGISVGEYERTSKGSLAYQELAQELLLRLV